MGFQSLLGNRQLKENISNAVIAGKTAHFYLISGPKGSGKHTLANLLAAALQCQSGGEKPCLTCPACRKVLDRTHPDYITVDDPEKKVVPVKLVRSAREDMFIKPNEGNKKIYLLPRAQDMEDPSQNALLKILEEPPGYGVFFLLTENPNKLLPTIRSRCVELKLTPLDRETLEQSLKQKFPGAHPDTLQAAIDRSGGWLGQAISLMEDGAELYPETEKFLTAYASKDPLALLSVLTPMEKYKRDKLLPVLEQWAEVLTQALVCRTGGIAVSPQARSLAEKRNPNDLLAAINTLQKCIEYARGSVSPGAICGYLAWALR